MTILVAMRALLIHILLSSLKWGQEKTWQPSHISITGGVTAVGKVIVVIINLLTQRQSLQPVTESDV